MTAEPGQVKPAEIRKLRQELQADAASRGYYLNPDAEVTDALVEGLLVNEQRYDYRSCPCRLASGNKDEDVDIICPCDYRDADVDEYGSCYCSLYVSKDVAEGKKTAESIPERRPVKEERKKKTGAAAVKPGNLSQPVWRCRVCGYLCARDAPPGTCPVCKAGKERFELFM